MAGGGEPEGPIPGLEMEYFQHRRAEAKIILDEGFSALRNARTFSH